MPDIVQEALSKYPELADSPLFNMSSEEFVRQYNELPPDVRGRMDIFFETMGLLDAGWQPLPLTGDAARLHAMKVYQEVTRTDELSIIAEDIIEAHASLRDGRLIWLGTVGLPTEKMIAERTRGLELFGERLINHPFGDRAYWIGLNLGIDAHLGGYLFCVQPFEDDAPPSDRSMRIFAYRFIGPIREDAGAPILHLANSCDVVIGPGGDFQFIGAEHEGGPPIGDDIGTPLASGLILDAVAFGLQLLNTENVPVEKVEPPPKLQKARARSGKPQLAPYFLVHSEEYVTVLRERGRDDGTNSPKGTHASPIMHIRRNHKRYLNPERTRWTFVRDCLVGARKTPLDDGPLKRKYYDASKLH